ncbi:MAG: hypothetical protein AAFQ42_04760 [Pseudomonadota bacterium]
MLLRTTSRHAVASIVAITFAVTAPAIAGGLPDVAAKSCPSGEKWDPAKKKCVNDPFSGGY